MSIERFKGTGLVKIPSEDKAFLRQVERSQEKMNKIILRAVANCREEIRLAALGEDESDAENAQSG